MEVNNILNLSHDQCCGCKLCADICPKQCISFRENDEGFFSPIVDEAVCIQCGLCISKCPVINPKYNKKVDICYAAYAKNKDSYNQGSSGGVFGIIARQVIKDGGVVVGAMFDKQLKVRHKLVTTEKDLELLFKSKYIQSDCSGIYNKVREYINKGIFVLFSGTPCQCNAIKNLFPKESSMLLVIDIVCHGVPSQSLFDKTNLWLNNKNNIQIQNFQFRYKGKGVKHPQSYLMTYIKNDKVRSIVGLHYQNPYYFGFQKHITLRKSCFSCKWACPNRVGDITLSDFWGIEKWTSQIEKNTPISMLALNTDKGLEYFNKIKKQLFYIKNIPYKFVVENNDCLEHPTKLPLERNSFFFDLKSKSFDDVVRLHLVPKRKYIFDIYYAIPKPIRKIVRKIMDKRMRYE